MFREFDTPKLIAKAPKKTELQLMNNPPQAKNHDYQLKQHVDECALRQVDFNFEDDKICDGISRHIIMITS